MKKNFAIHSAFGGKTINVQIVIDKNGLSVTEDGEHYGDIDWVIRKYLITCIDDSDWSHSFHMAVSSAKYKGNENRVKVKKILDEKIKQAEIDIKNFKDAKQILSRWHL